MVLDSYVGGGDGDAEKTHNGATEPGRRTEKRMWNSTARADARLVAVRMATEAPSCWRRSAAMARAPAAGGEQRGSGCFHFLFSVRSPLLRFSVCESVASLISPTSNQIRRRIRRRYSRQESTRTLTSNRHPETVPPLLPPPVIVGSVSSRLEIRVAATRTMDPRELPGFCVAVKVQYLRRMFRRTRSRHPKSDKLFEAASRILPGGVDSPVRAFKSVGGDADVHRARRAARSSRTSTATATSTT